MMQERMSSLNGGRIFLGIIFFAASLTPSLVPRAEFDSGLPPAARSPSDTASAPARIGCGDILSCRKSPSASGVPSTCWRCSDLFFSPWPHSAGHGLAEFGARRDGHEAGGVELAFILCIVAIATFLLILVVAWLFKGLTRVLAARIRKFIPRRAANVIAVLAAIALFWSITNDVISTALNMLDSALRRTGQVVRAGTAATDWSRQNRSPHSLVKWEELGRTGRRFALQAPLPNRSAASRHAPLKHPFGFMSRLPGAATAEQRAKLAFDELQRQGGFDRSTLIIVTPTGTG